MPHHDAAKVFVDVLSPETALYVWDTCVLLSFDVVYHFCVCLLAVLKVRLRV